MSRNMILRSALVGLAFSALAVPVAGSTQAGAIVGTVTDQEGQGLGEVTLTVSHQGSGETLSVETSPSGRFLVSGLAPGVYDLAFELDDFKDLEPDPVQLAAGGELVLDVTMEADSGGFGGRFRRGLGRVAGRVAKRAGAEVVDHAAGEVVDKAVESVVENAAEALDGVGAFAADGLGAALLGVDEDDEEDAGAGGRIGGLLGSVLGSSSEGEAEEDAGAGGGIGGLLGSVLGSSLGSSSEGEAEEDAGAGGGIGGLLGAALGSPSEGEAGESSGLGEFLGALDALGEATVVIRSAGEWEAEFRRIGKEVERADADALEALQMELVMAQSQMLMTLSQSSVFYEGGASYRAMVNELAQVYYLMARKDGQSEAEARKLAEEVKAGFLSHLGQ